MNNIYQKPLDCYYVDVLLSSLLFDLYRWNGVLVLSLIIYRLSYLLFYENNNKTLGYNHQPRQYTVDERCSMVSSIHIFAHGVKRKVNTKRNQLSIRKFLHLRNIHNTILWLQNNRDDTLVILCYMPFSLKIVERVFWRKSPNHQIMKYLHCTM